MEKRRQSVMGKKGNFTPIDEGGDGKGVHCVAHCRQLVFSARPLHCRISKDPCFKYVFSLAPDISPSPLFHDRSELLAQTSTDRASKRCRKRHFHAHDAQKMLSSMIIISSK
ncbi:hypothetical protein ACLOJK_029775 [Asimina triloba]